MAYIFKDIDAVRGFVTVNLNTKIELLNPHLRSATQRHLQPLLGSVELGNLISAYNAATLTPAQNLLLPYAQQVAAQYMMLLALPTMTVHFSSMGVQEVRGKDGTTDGLRQWTYFENKGALEEAADIAAEELLAFLDASPATAYPDWEASTAFTRARQLFLNSATELAEYIDVRGSHRAYLALRPIVKNFVERQSILPWICQAQFDALKAQILAGSLTSENKALLSRIRPVVAYNALLKLSNQVSVWLGADGLRMPSTGNYAHGTPTKDADPELRAAFRKEMQSMADASTTALQQFILDNIADYPLIEGSSCNTIAKPRQPFQFRDQSGQTSFMT
jgi:hypothetical protein